MKCLICDREFISLSSHFKTHKLTSKEYYDAYLKKDGDDICSCGCEKRTTFNPNFGRYNKYLHGHNYHLGMLGKKNSPESNRKNSESNIGREVSIATRKKISRKNKGRIKSREERLLISRSKMGTKRAPFSLDTRRKMSIAQIDYIEQQKLLGRSCFPYEGKYEDFICNIIHSLLNLESTEYLRNDKKLFHITGKWPDDFLVKYNLVIEVLEEHHFNVQTGELCNYDLNRQVVIAYWLGCMIYYIRAKDFINNQEKEIQRLKNFLIVLDEGRN